jgi:hypothetical protein
VEREGANLKTPDQKIRISREFESLVANDSSELPASQVIGNFAYSLQTDPPIKNPSLRGGVV